MSEESMDREKTAECPGCQRERTFTWSTYCGAWLCDHCDWHLGLDKCFCGWHLAPGERLEDDVDE
jgi:hypothetical protein